MQKFEEKFEEKVRDARQKFEEKFKEKVRDSRKKFEEKKIIRKSQGKSRRLKEKI